MTLETSPSTDTEASSRLSLAVQGVYFAATGIWPLVSIGSFQKVTGPKTDLWLVKTVGVLVTAIGATLIAASRRKSPPPEAQLLALGSAAALAAIDVTYAAKGRISPVYLLDAVAEAAFMAKTGNDMLAARESGGRPVSSEAFTPDA